MDDPSGENAERIAVGENPKTVCLHSPVAVSQIFAVSSAEAVTTALAGPEGEFWDDAESAAREIVGQETTDKDKITSS